MPRALSTRRWVEALPACVMFGLWYGAVCGAVFGTLAGPLGTYAGALLGGAGGLVTGLLGCFCRGPLGWALAGLIGGYVAGSCLVLAFGGWFWLPHIAALPLIPGSIGAVAG